MRYTKPKRIDIEMDKEIKDYAMRENLRYREASRDLANKLRQLRIRRDLKF